MTFNLKFLCSKTLLPTVRRSVQGRSGLSLHVNCLSSCVHGAQCGFATTQEAYDSNIVPLFESLDRLEGILKEKDFLVGGELTEADVRLYTTMVSVLHSITYMISGFPYRAISFRSDSMWHTMERSRYNILMLHKPSHYSRF